MSQHQRHYRPRYECDIPVLAAWRILVNGLITGRATKEDVRTIEQSIATSKIDVWMDALKASRDEICDLTRQQLGQPGVVPAEFETDVFDNGLVDYVFDAKGVCRPERMRALAAIFIAPARLNALSDFLYRRGLPEWCRVVCRASTKEPANNATVGGFERHSRGDQSAADAETDNAGQDNASDEAQQKRHDPVIPSR